MFLASIMDILTHEDRQESQWTALCTESYGAGGREPGEIDTCPEEEVNPENIKVSERDAGIM